MKILIFEYITGGGCNQQQLSQHLIGESQLMLNTLLDNFRVLADIEITLMLDERLVQQINTENVKLVLIDSQKNSVFEFNRLLALSDAVWVIAPESFGILQSLCQIVADANKLLLNSAASAVAITANKWLTYQHLKYHNIATIDTELLNESFVIPSHLLKNNVSKEWVVKPIDGVACSHTYLINNSVQLQQLPLNAYEAIIQPHIKGKKTSLSCLCDEGRAWLICVNEQHCSVVDGSYQLDAITVNSMAQTQYYYELVNKIARSFPTLWGYVGIDLIETDTESLVLEINPRLTSSFVGIHAATGLNIAEQVLLLLQGEPNLSINHNKAVTIGLNQNKHALN